MTLSAALADLNRRLGYQATPATDVTTRLTAFLNEAQQDVLGEIGGRRLLHGTLTFASIANQAEYGLTAAIARVLSIRDTANNRRLQEIPESTYRTLLPNTSTATGTPYAYSTLGMGLVSIKPSSGAALYVLSSAAGDTTQTAYAEVIDNNGRRVLVSATLTGVTAVQIATGAVDIVDFYLSATTAGTIELHQTSGAGTLLSTIFAGQTSQRFQRVALVTTPSAALTYTVDCEYDATDLVNATDEFPVPMRFARCVETRAMTYEYLKQGDQLRYGITMTEYRRELGKLNHYLVSGPDQLIIPGSGIQSPSVLPGNWPWDGYGVR